MTRLKHYRTKEKMRLREVASKLGLTIGTVHDAEVRGIQTPRLAAKYAAAFPGLSWKDLIEPPQTAAEK